MIPAPWTAVHNSPQSSARQNVGRRGALVHHQAGTNFNHLRDLVLGRVPGRVVSYTAITRDQQLELVVSNDARRPWSAGTAYWDSALRSICLSNSSLNGWQVSDASVWSAARAIAHWAQRDRFWPHRDGNPRSWTVLGHGELRPIHGASIATACPGGSPLGLITARAQLLLRGGVPGQPGGYPNEEDEMTRNAGVYWRRASDGELEFMVFNTDSGWRANHSGVSGPYNNAVAAALDTPPWAAITEAHARVFMTALDATRASKASGTVTVAMPAPALVDAGELEPIHFDDSAIDQSDLDANGHDIHPTDAPYPEEQP